MQRYFGIKKVDNEIILDSGDYHHIKNVMRNSDGDLIEAVVDNRLYLACIENVKSNIKIIVKKELEIEQEFAPKINLIIPLLKENKMDLILQKSCELGVFKITVIPLKRCVVRADSNKISSKVTRWKRILKEASEQSNRSCIPNLEYKKSIDELADLHGLKVLCSTKKNLSNVKRVLTENRNCDTMNVVIGPEGGFDNSEEELLNKYGFISTTLGFRIMRVETVPIFIMSIINFEYME